MENIKNRNQLVDAIRGFAMLMVVFGHTMTSCTKNSEDSFLFNFIWALQMPLFMLISGYVSRYSKKLDTVKSFLNFIKRRSLAYLLPWAVWSFLIRGVIFGQSNFLNIKWLIFNMDSGYWFLFSIWTISMVFGISRFIALKISKAKSEITTLIFTVLIFILGATVIGVIGLKMGFSFLCIKLTLYYMPFYMAGAIFGKLQNKIFASKSGKMFIEMIVAVCCLIFIAIIIRVNLYTISDNAINIGLRAFTSLAGCIAICGLFITGANTENKLYCVLSWVGTNSLEIYLIHNFFLALIVPPNALEFSTPMGIALVLVNFIVTTILSSLLAKLLNNNKFTRLFLFGK